MLRLISRTLALAVAALSHLVLVPVMAIYGVSICPMLSERGFGFGCRYTVLQADIVEWLTHGWLRWELARLPALAQDKDSRFGLTLRWLYGRAWSAMPFLVFLVISGTVITRQFMDIVDMDSAELKVGAIHGILFQLSQVVGFLVVWLMLVRLFTVLKEKQLVEDVHRHLNALAKLDAGFHSPTVASGYWTTIFNGLNQTSELLGQRARLIKGFSSYVTGSVVEKVLNNQALRLEGERRELTIISSDLRNFTGISNKLPAEKVVQMLNIYFGDMIEVMIGHGVTLDKFIGDGILAYVGAADGNSSGADRAVAAALAMHERLLVTNQKLRVLGLPDLEIGVGVHAGSVILGSIGAPEKMQHTIIGEPVNIAARLEPLCKRLHVGIVVSDEVFANLSPKLQRCLQQGGTQEIRGVEAPVAIHTWARATVHRAAA
ncbi:MAG: adenylate/guanylate cyclase domain-containing protein [Deltaproteobacteria bacterium]|nr:adenylate/guanylate cyclase domain-containing protein [Deltaproteobacteria bacterium]